MKTDTKIGFVCILLLVVVLGVFHSVNSVVAQDTGDEPQEVFTGEIVGTTEEKVCCEITNSGLSCLDVKEEDCSPDGRKANSACSSTAFCNPGYCFDSDDGTCSDGVPQVICNQEGGTWSVEQPEACNLGCCSLGDEAALTTLASCKSLSGGYGLETDWDPSITDQDVCIATAGAHVKGACVYEEDGLPTCQLLSKEDCIADNVLGQGFNDQISQEEGPSDVVVDSGDDETVDEDSEEEEVVSEEDSSDEEPLNAPPAGACSDGVCFYEGYLCSAEELNTNCGPTEQTTCLDGKEEVYFVDSCGNPANIYDASKVNDQNYWSVIQSKAESCNSDSNNENSQTCGNCNYVSGSFCRAASSETANPTYGDYVCKSLNCVDTEGNARLHGESWCATDQPQFQDSGINLVGSKYFRNVCINNEIKVEPCAEFRQETCIESTASGISEAACRVNRWQDCTAQTKKDSCLNTDRRDCKWLEGIEFVLLGVRPQDDDSDEEQSTVGGANSLAGLKEKAQQYEAGDLDLGACVPANPPGLDFYGAVEERGEGQASSGSDNGAGQATSEAEAICAQANAACPVTYTKKKFLDGDDEWECVENCECLTAQMEQSRAGVCMAMGDCGPNRNFINQEGSTLGYKITQEEQSGGDDDGGIL